MREANCLFALVLAAVLFGVGSASGAVSLPGSSQFSPTLDARKAIRAPTPAQTKSLAESFERRLEQLNKQFEEEQEKMIRASVDILIFGGRKDQMMGAFDEYRRSTRPLILEMTILTQRLQRYKETGILPKDVPNVERLKRFIDNPWTRTTPIPELERDLPALIKQLQRYDNLLRLPSTIPPVKQPGAQAELATLPVKAVRKEKIAAEPKFEADAGKAKSEINPVPELISLLSAGAPRQRALAADELGRLAGAAASAVTALRNALSDPDPRVRASVVLALGSVGGLSPEVIEDMRRALSDKNEDVRFSARTALERLQTPGFSVSE